MLTGELVTFGILVVLVVVVALVGRRIQTVQPRQEQDRAEGTQGSPSERQTRARKVIVSTSTSVQRTQELDVKEHDNRARPDGVRGRSQHRLRPRLKEIEGAF